MLGPLKKKKLSAAFDQSGVILFIWGYTVKTGHKEATLCVSLPLSVASFSLPHTHGARAHSFLCLCAHTAVDLALGSTKVKIWYITQRLIDFSTPGELPALSTGVRERETDRVRGRKSESSTLCSTKSDSLTGFPGCSWNYRPLCPQIHCGHMAEQKCVCTHVCALLNNTGNYNCQRESRWLGVCKRIRNKCQTCSFGPVDFSANAPVAAAALHRNASSNSHKCTQSPVKNKWP